MFTVNTASFICLAVTVRCFVSGDTTTMSIAGLLNLIVVVIGRRLDGIDGRLARMDAGQTIKGGSR